MSTATPELEVKMREMKTRLAPYLKHGPSAAVLRLVKGALQPWLEWGTLVFLEQDLETTPGVPGSATHEIRELSSADLPALISFQRDQADLARRLARGDRAFAFFDACPSRGPCLSWRHGDFATRELRSRRTVRLTRSVSIRHQSGVPCR
jgi:hypothetical protein